MLSFADDTMLVLGYKQLLSYSNGHTNDLFK